MFDYEGPLGLPRMTDISPYTRMKIVPREWEPCDKHARDEMDEDICTAIKEVSLELLSDDDEYGATDVESLNNGYCYYIADKAYYLLDKPEEVDVVERHSPMGSNHGYIRYNGRYFDAEVPHGVDSYEEVPFFTRYPIDVRGEGILRSEGESAMGPTEWIEE